ncbi:MAG TPA: LemA family protein [Rudaea sp.]|nr:LemA family protein [Rudaea sp.]
MTFWIAACVLIALAFFVGITFNELIASRNRVRNAWADIDVQLQRRHDLVPQLVATVQGYAAHERETLTKITELRARAQQRTSIADKSQIESQLGSGVDRVLAIAEAYPDLKASGNFLELQRELVAVEDQLQAARSDYNEAVRAYNTQIQNFPDIAIAKPFGFGAMDYFQADNKDPITL